MSVLLNSPINQLINPWVNQSINQLISGFALLFSACNFLDLVHTCKRVILKRNYDKLSFFKTISKTRKLNFMLNLREKMNRGVSAKTFKYDF